MTSIVRESMQFDVLIVGAGPAGLSAAIRLAQWSRKKSFPLKIALIEKGAYVGAHLLSGAVLEPTALNELIPDWKSQHAPLNTPVTQDEFWLLDKKRKWLLPVPGPWHNGGNYIISLGNFCQWLAQQAEQLNVAIFPGFAGSQVLYDGENKVIGIQTDDRGLNKQGLPTQRFEPGLHLLAQQTFFAEGCRGSLSERVIEKYQLRRHSSFQTYAIGIKELWKINPSKHQLGKVVHTVGWPLDRRTYGGSFIYHTENYHLALGLIVGLDYTNPYLDPFQELQRFKTHPAIHHLLEGGECIGFGARALNEGGWQSIPQLTFPGGVLLGCAAGFLNVAKIKGIHYAMKSGMLAADALIATLEKNAPKNELTHYTTAIQHSWIKQELYVARNIRPAFRWGLWPGLLYSALDHYLLRGQAPWTLSHGKPDHLAFKLAKNSTAISYSAPDGKLTFDKLSAVYLSGTRHREDEPCHLKLKHPEIPIQWNQVHYAAPEQRYCPAGVYELINKDNALQLQINAANCIHCKACDIKDPTQNICWVTPEGGDGPRYVNM